jgi:hypothetical protein
MLAAIVYLNLSYRVRTLLTISEYSRRHDFSLGDNKKGLKVLREDDSKHDLLICKLCIIFLFRADLLTNKI